MLELQDIDKTKNAYSKSTIMIVKSKYDINKKFSCWSSKKKLQIFQYEW